MAQGKKTHANCLVISSVDDLIKKRVEFIVANQQMKSSNTRRDAYMVYDNEKNEIYLNNTHNCNPVDRDEGAERVGMGVLLAKYYQLHPVAEVKASLLRYASFCVIDCKMLTIRLSLQSIRRDVTGRTIMYG